MKKKYYKNLNYIWAKRQTQKKHYFFFDEVQVSENFIVSLKYFNEAEKPYKIICAGSLLRSKNKQI